MDNVLLTVLVHPLSSVAIKVYVPSPKLVCERSVIATPFCVYVFVPVPPPTVHVIDPSLPPSHVGLENVLLMVMAVGSVIVLL